MMRGALIAAALAASMPIAAANAAGTPGLRGSDHLAITVPDLAQAVEFFTDVIGCQSVYSYGAIAPPGDYLHLHLDVDVAAYIGGIRMMRCGNGVNLQIWTWDAPDQRTQPPKNSDIGGHYLAFYVDDMAAAVEHLKAKGVRMLGGPSLRGEGPAVGQTYVVFVTPWGMNLAFVSYPDGMAYEKDAPVKLWSPK